MIFYPESQLSLQNAIPSRLASMHSLNVGELCLGFLIRCCCSQSSSAVWVSTSRALSRTLYAHARNSARLKLMPADYHEFAACAAGWLDLMRPSTHSTALICQVHH